MTDTDWMKIAIAKAREGLAAGQSPFAACIVRGPDLIASEHNKVYANTDVTAHGEVQTIRQACTKLQKIDLCGCTIYSTCEPCPMCFAACHWANLDRIVYGAAISDAAAAGFRELTLSNEQMKQQGQSPITLTPGVLQKECAKLFKTFRAHGFRPY